MGLLGSSQRLATPKQQQRYCHMAYAPASHTCYDDVDHWGVCQRRSPARRPSLPSDMSPETSRPTVEDVFDEPITRRSSRPAAMVNVRGLPYVIPDSVPPAGEESEEQTLRSRPALTGRKINAEEAAAAPARGAPADRDGTAERAPTSASGSAAATSASKAAMTTAVAVMALAPAVVDGSVA
jgi:hypothetical protein